MTERFAYAMRLAIEEAWRYQLLTYPNPAVGAAIVDRHGAILSVAAHQEAGRAHAEVLAIRDAYIALTDDATIAEWDDAHRLHHYLLSRAKNLFHDKTIVVTLEPCAHLGKTPACADLIGALKFRRVVLGQKDSNPDAAGGAKRLASVGMEVIEGVEEARCQDLLFPFQTWQRRGRFCFFKLAQTLNGVIDGGTISSETSRRWVHRIRAKIDTLLIGGATVRADRPRLDARLVGGKAPDVAILTRHPEKIDRSMPLFQIPNRKVEYVTSIPKRGLVMVEGGGGSLETLKNEIDGMVLFVAPRIKEGLRYNGAKEFALMHQRMMGEDAMLWLRVKNG